MSEIDEQKRAEKQQ
jgi:hypothetical protein